MTIMGLFDAGAAPVTLGIAGIVVSVVCAWLFYWLGGRVGRRQNSALLKEISELRKLLAEYVQSMSERLDTTSLLYEGHIEPSSESLEPADTIGRSEPNVAIEELVRASLGALVNEKGEVEMSRLMREVSLAMGSQDPSVAFEVLRRLRPKGVVDWGTSDELLPQASTLYVQPLRPKRRIRSSVSEKGKQVIDRASRP
jgi:hypothetical protein